MTRIPVSVNLTSEEPATIMTTIIYLLFATSVAMAGITKPTNTLKEGNEVFTARMFSEVVQSNPGKSVVISAFSVLPPLAQLTLASEGTTHSELQSVIGFSDDEAIKKVFSEVNRDLRSIKGVELKMANKIYVHEGGQLNDEFAVISRDVFNSEVQNIDFEKSEIAAKTINTWVEDQTNKRIKDLVNADSLTADTAAVLVNAIYFKGTWSNKFDTKLTADRDFYTSKDTTISIPTMYKRDEFKYGESAQLQAQLIEIPYVGEQSSLLVVLPTDKEGITQLVEKLKDPKVLEDAQKNMYETEVDLFLPKFKIETETDLKDVLTKLGVEQLFAPGAKLNKLIKNENGFYVSKATQKAFIEVNEEGAEAAAANAFQIQLLSAIISKRTVFRADHPFIFFLRGNGITMFTGVYRP